MSDFGGQHVAFLRELAAQLDPLAALTAELGRAIAEQPPLTVREGGMIRQGYAANLDELRLLSSDSKTWIAALRQRDAAVAAPCFGERLGESFEPGGHATPPDRYQTAV